MKTVVLLFAVFTGWVQASDQKFTVIAGEDLLKKADLKSQVSFPWIQGQGGVGITQATEVQLEQLSQKAHELGRCGGFHFSNASVKEEARSLESMGNALAKQKAAAKTFVVPTKFLNASSLVQTVSKTELQNTTQTISRPETRFHKHTKSNETPEKIRALLDSYVKKSAKTAATVELISHRNSPQKSVRARILGKSFPNEKVIIGGHLDSINSNLFSLKKLAPGFDDNASGSAAVIEVFRVLIESGIQFDRTLEFYWYAAEEVGLVGSKEIADAAKAQKDDVVSVMQLDMVTYPGSGEGLVTLIDDFTSATFNKYLETMITQATSFKVARDRCGYGCSDHASWTKNGFASAMPSESGFKQINPDIHTERDVENRFTRFSHAEMFAKVGVLYMVNVGNSRVRF